MRVLVVKMSSLGDVIHTLPALGDAASALPGLTFDWVVEEAFAEIPAWHPAVDQVIPVALRRWRKRPVHSLRGPEWRRARHALGRAHYDAVIDAQGLVKSAFIARLVKAPRYGMDSRSVRERLATAVYHHRVHVPRDMHAVERTRLLFARALKYPVPEGQGDYCLRGNLPGAGGALPGLLFFHGTARAEKLWPEDHWVALGQLAAASGLRVWLPWGDDRERDRADRVAGRLDNAEVLPRLDLAGLADMLLRVRGSVAVDTGLGHLAAALDVPTVSLYGPTSTRLIGAYGKNQVHMESPVGAAHSRKPRARMEAIQPDLVWAALQGILPGAV